MKKVIAVAVSLIAILGVLWAIDAAAAAYPTGVGGTGTTATPSAGQVLVGTGGGIYTPAYLLCAGSCQVSSASGTITITGTGVSTTTGNWQGTWQLYNPSDFVPSSTQIVNTVNGGSGTVTITSSTLNVIWPTVNGSKSAAYQIVAGTGATTTVSGATTTISVSLNNGATQTCSGSQFVNSITAGGITSCGSVSFSTYTFSAGTGISISIATSSSNTTTTVTLNINNGSVQNCTTGQSVDQLSATGIISCAISINTIAGVSTSSISIVAGTGIGIATTTNSITISNNGVTSFNGQSGAATYTNNAGTGLSVTTSTTSSTYTLNLNGGSVQTCTSGQLLNSISATGTITCQIAIQTIAGVSTTTISISGTANEVTVATTTNSVTLSTPQAIGTGSSPTFAGVTITGNTTSTTFTASGTSTASNYQSTDISPSYIYDFNSLFSLPTPTALAAGAQCGGVSGVTDVIACLNDDYASVSSTASSSLVIAPGFSYPSSTTSININTNGERMVVQCVPGGTVFNYNGTSTGLFLNAGSSGSLNQSHPPSYGFWGCHLNGPSSAQTATTTGLVYGGSNGAEGAVFAYGQITNFGTCVKYASSSWKTLLQTDDINSCGTLWNFPSGLTNAGEHIEAVDTNFHDNTNTSGTISYVNCITGLGGGYFDFEYDNFDDCQINWTGSGVFRIENYYGENPGGDANLASYTPIINGSGNTQTAVMELSGLAVFTQDGVTASGTPSQFILNSSTLNLQSAMVIRNSASGTVNSFITVKGSGGGQICNVTADNTPYSNFANGFENEMVSSNGQLSGCVQSANGNWFAGLVDLTNNTISIVNGGAIQFSVGTGGATVGVVSSSVASFEVTSSTSATATTSVAIGPTSGANKGKLCLWNGTNYTVLEYNANATSTILATSTTCTAN